MTDSRDEKDGNEADREYETVDPLAGRGGDAPPPASPARRGVAGMIAFLLIAIIATFLVWFIATHTERRKSGLTNSGEALAVHPLPPLPNDPPASVLPESGTRPGFTGSPGHTPGSGGESSPEPPLRIRGADLPDPRSSRASPRS